MSWRTTRYLLDANLSPKVGRFLNRQLGLDVISLHGQGIGQLPDSAVIKMAQSLGRVIITLDRDFVGDPLRPPRFAVGIIYLDLPNPLRTIPGINQTLASFFQTRAGTIDLERARIVITEDETRVVVAG